MGEGEEYLADHGQPDGVQRREHPGASDDDRAPMSERQKLLLLRRHRRR
jgi:hypothetical protein